MRRSNARARSSLVAVGMVAVTLSEELHDMVERLQEIEHGSPSKVFQGASVSRGTDRPMRSAVC
jgi:hypothetical protein